MLVIAINNFVSGDVKIVRLGNSSRPNLTKYSLDEVAKKYCAGSSHVESLEIAVRPGYWKSLVFLI